MSTSTLLISKRKYDYVHIYFILLIVYPFHRIVLPKYYGKVIHSLRKAILLLRMYIS